VVRADELRSALASSVLAPSTLVWREGMPGWVPAFTVPELGSSESSIQEMPTDGTTDVAPAPKIPLPPDAELSPRPIQHAIQPPPLVIAGKIAGSAPETGSVADTGRPTPTELLNDTGQSRKESRDANGGPRPAAGQPAVTPFKIGAAPKPIAAAKPAGKIDAAAGSKLAGARPTTGGGLRKPEGVKPKAEAEELTLVAEASDPFKLKGAGESASNGASGAPMGPSNTAALGPSNTAALGPKEPSRVAASLASRRPVTRTALIPGNEPPKAESEAPRPAAGRPASVAPAPLKRSTGVPPPPVQIGPRKSASVAPAAKASPSQPAPDPKGFRTTAFMGSSGSSAPAAGGAAPVAIPSAPRVPSAGPSRPGFAIVENTSTDSTGVLPLGRQYAAEPTSEPAAAPAPAPSPAAAHRPAQPSYVEGAPAFAERTHSFPEGAGPGAHPEPRAPMRSHPPPADPAQGAIYPPAPHPNGAAPRMDFEVPAGSAFARAAAAGGYGPDAARASHPDAQGAEGMPYSAPPPPLALGEPGYGEIRTTGALPLVHAKRSLTHGQPLVAPASHPPPGYSQPPGPTTTMPPPVTTPPPPSAEIDVAQGPTKVGDPIVVPMSSLFGAGAMLIAMAVMAFFMGRCSVAPGPAAAPARLAFAALPRLARAALPAPPKPCWMAKQPVRWAPAVLQSVPVDVAPTANGVMVAYARDAHEPATVEVNFATGALDDKAADKREGDVVRVFAPREGAGLLVTTKSDAGPLAPYVYAPGASPFVIGLAGRGTPNPSVALADKPEDAPQTLWTVPPLDEDKGLEAARVLGTGPNSYALVFRRSGGILAGYVGEGKKPNGGLSVVAGSGGSVGRPALGMNKREIAVVFGDRQNSDAPWEIRVGHAALGQMPRETSVVPLPKGGPGGDAFAPDVAGIADGRWVIVWTEGKSGAYAVRAQTFGPDFQPLGDPIAISPPAGNFGQAVVGVAGSYVTTMFLSRASTGSYELWGAVLQCGS